MEASMKMPFESLNTTGLDRCSVRVLVEPVRKTEMVRALDIAVGPKIMWVNGVRPNGRWLANQQLTIHRRSLRAFAYALLWLDAGPIGRMAIEAGVEKLALR